MEGSGFIFLAVGRVLKKANKVSICLTWIYLSEIVNNLMPSPQLIWKSAQNGAAG